MPKRSANWFAKAVGQYRKAGMSFKAAVSAAKGKGGRSKGETSNRPISKPRFMTHRRYGHKRRGSTRKITMLKILKWGIAVGPPAVRAANAYTNAGGGTTGITQGAMPALVSSYTGFDTTTGKWVPGDLVWGYAPLLGAWVFGKIASRVLR